MHSDAMGSLVLSNGFCCGSGLCLLHDVRSSSPRWRQARNALTIHSVADSVFSSLLSCKGFSLGCPEPTFVTREIGASGSAHEVMQLPFRLHAYPLAGSCPLSALAVLHVYYNLHRSYTDFFHDWGFCQN
jgi:hypothetical protein